MSYEVLYEINKVNFPIDSVISLIIGIGFGYNGLKCLRLLLKKKFSFYNFFWTIVGAVVVFFMSIAFFASFSWGGSDNAAFAKEYYNGNYETVEGYVENYDNEWEACFDVDGKEFTVARNDLNGQAHHSIKEGDYVRIKYIKDGEGDYVERWIVKLEIRRVR